MSMSYPFQIATLTASLFFTACGTTHTPVSPDLLQDLAGSSKLTVIHYKPQNGFTILTGQAATRGNALGMLGGVGGPVGVAASAGGVIEAGAQIDASSEEGAKFISLTKVTDPIGQVEERFLHRLQQELKLQNVPVSEPFGSDEPQKLYEQFGAGYVLDFQTEIWRIDPIKPRGVFSLLPDGYELDYRARARLVNLKDRTIAWKGTCWQTDQKASLPKLTEENIRGHDQGIAVKAALHTLAQACADHLMKKFFGRDMAADLTVTSGMQASK